MAQPDLCRMQRGAASDRCQAWQLLWDLLAAHMETELAASLSAHNLDLAFQAMQACTAPVLAASCCMSMRMSMSMSMAHGVGMQAYFIAQFSRGREDIFTRYHHWELFLAKLVPPQSSDWVARTLASLVRSVLSRALCSHVPTAL